MTKKTADAQRKAAEAALAAVKGACAFVGFLLTDLCVPVHNENAAKPAPKKSQKKAERKEAEMDTGLFCLFCLGVIAPVQARRTRQRKSQPQRRKPQRKVRRKQNRKKTKT